ncbi:hypothetical protein ABN773_27250 (plasmid) [Escherichia coli]
MSHVLEGASQEDLNLYRAEVERDQAYGNWRDFFLNKKGSVTSVSGDANLDQIADVSYLLDTFFAKVTRTALQKRRLHRGPDDHHRSHGGRGPEEGRAGDAAGRRHGWHGRHGFLMRLARSSGNRTGHCCK